MVIVVVFFFFLIISCCSEYGPFVNRGSFSTVSGGALYFYPPNGSGYGLGYGFGFGDNSVYRFLFPELFLCLVRDWLCYGY